jgi:putative membrane protein
MNAELREFGKRWLISTVAVLLAAHVLPGISYDRWSDVVIAALLLGILNSILRPLLLLLALPLLLLTLGLFTLIINAGMLYLVHLLLPGFHVEGFWSAFFGALIISVVTVVLNTLTGGGQARIQFQRGRRPPPPPDDGDDQGPVIDV